LFGLLLITFEVGPPVVAQSPVLPYATLRTLPQTSGEVWPGDFNEDGITDLASGADDMMDPINSEAPIRVAVGNGDGTFQAPIVSATVGWVRAVADLNRDGFVDVIAATPEGLIVLPGNGNGTLQAPRQVTMEGGFGGFVLAVDLNSDGNRDLVLMTFPGGNPYVGIFAGRGDFTFADPVLLPIGQIPQQAVTGDFDSDGRLDIAIAHVDPAQLTIYLNAGLLQFTPSTIPLPKAALDLTPRDLNGDRSPRSGRGCINLPWPVVRGRRLRLRPHWRRRRHFHADRHVPDGDRAHCDRPGGFHPRRPPRRRHGEPLVPRHRRRLRLPA
jgi:hypothetical protein